MHIHYTSHGWQMIVDEEEMSQSEGTESKNAIEHLKRLYKKFETPLVAAGADLNQLLKEFTETLQYAISFIFLTTVDYQMVWWMLFHVKHYVSLDTRLARKRCFKGADGPFQLKSPSYLLAI